MNCCKAISVLLGIYLLFPSSLYSQFKFDKAVNIGKEKGLPSQNVRAICKSDDGFIWLGTDDGLCRFDGQEIKVFVHGDDLRHSIFDNVVHALLADKNFIWIGTSQGISVLNTTDFTFRHYQLTDSGKAKSVTRRFDQVIYNLYKDKQGKIWVGTRVRGFYRYDADRDDFTYFPVPLDKYPTLSPTLGGYSGILSIEESETNDSIIWAGTTGGLEEVNKFTGEVKAYTFPQKSKDYQVAINSFRRLYHHDDGLLYVGSWAAGVNVFNPVTKTLTPLEVESEEGKKILKGTISGFYRKNDHEIWISTGWGLSLYDTQKKDIIWLKYNNITENEFYSIDYKDENNRIWHVNYNGLHYYDPAMQQFSTYSFNKLSEAELGFAFYIIPDKSGNNIAVCPRVTDGIYFFDKLKKTWRRSPFPYNKRFSDEKDVIRGFQQLPSGDYILSSYKGIFFYSEKKNQLTDITKSIPVSPTRWGEIILDGLGNLWISTDAEGLIKWNLATRKSRIYTKELLRADSVNASVRLVNFFLDSKNNLWFERSGGFGVHVAETDSILNFIYKKNDKNSFPAISSFAQDRKGRVWLSGDDGWLGYAMANDPYKGVVFKMDLKEKGISGSLPLLASDHNGDIWGYTAKELVKMNVDDLGVTTYSFSYGIDEPDFYHFSFLPSGEIVFGGRNNIAIANPAELKRNTELPSPYIDEVQVLNQPISFLMNGSPLQLGHKQNFFSIGFSAIAYTMPKDIKFRYRLNGFDNWTVVSGRRFANYTNVPGGDYIFQLQAANNEGLWSDKILELPVHITTPFWLTSWFRIAAASLIVFIAYSLYRYRVGMVKKKQKLKSDYEKKLANVEMSALLAQMNPHFLFNSLNSIDSYIIRNESKKASEYLNNFARLMRLILQNSRSNYISLKDELEALELYMQMECLRFKNKFCYSIAVDENIDTNSIVIPPMLIQPYVENAIWHGLMHKTNGEEGAVKISVSKKADDLHCVIEDNGIGRKRAAELKEQKQSSHKRSMGMQITQDRIEIINKLYDMNASINIYDMEDENGNAKGTKVELTIPV